MSEEFAHSTCYVTIDPCSYIFGAYEVILKSCLWIRLGLLQWTDFLDVKNSTWPVKLLKLY